MVTIREWYERVNAAWPAHVPPMKPKDAINAAKRLYRFATGKKLGWVVKVTSGNRHTWGRNWSGVLRVNPTKGWREFVHDFSHWLDRVALRRREKPHAREHAKLELRLVREIVKRGWLNPEPTAAPQQPKLEPEPTAAPQQPKPEPVPPSPDPRKAAKLAHATKMLARAERRLKLATTIAKKWRRRVALYSRKLQVQQVQK